MANPIPPNTTCEIRRPFGGAVQSSGVPCRHITNFQQARNGMATAALPYFTSILETDGTVDIRDGCTRTVGSNLQQYADGDEVRIPDANGSIYVVTWVEKVLIPEAGTFITRAYLMRDTANWSVMASSQ
jgi:hypothetical protein